jgi:hypothetical protein
MTDVERHEVDMSPEAIERRLREVAMLYRLGISIGKARRIGRVGARSPERTVKPSKHSSNTR